MSTESFDALLQIFGYSVLSIALYLLQMNALRLHNITILQETQSNSSGTVLIFANYQNISISGVNIQLSINTIPCTATWLDPFVGHSLNWFSCLAGLF